jgi:hypothetical protein
MGRHLNRFAALACLVALCSACPQDDVPLAIKLFPVPHAQPTCNGKGIDAKDVKTELAKSAYKLRFSFFEQRLGQLGPLSLRRQSLNCFRVVEPAESLEFIVPLAEVKRFTVRVDAFDKTTGNLAYSGMVHDVDLTAATMKIFMQRAGAKSCDYLARKLRAFHSATVLPNGKVLLIGGLVTKDGSAELKDVAYANTSISRFDPSTLSWNIIESGEAGLARAFHKALLLPSPAEGPYRILLTGGVMAKDASDPLVARVARQPNFACTQGGDCPFFFNFLPHEAAAPGETALLTYTPGPTPKISYQPLPSVGVSSGYFPQLALVDDSSALLVPGVSAYRAESLALHGFGDAPMSAYWLSLPQDGPPTAQPTPIAGLRGGHTVGLTNQGALIVGGLLDGDLAAQRDNYALASGGPASMFAAKAAPPGLYEAAFGSLTPLGLTDQALASGTPATDLLLVPGIPGQQAPGTGNRSHVPRAVLNCGGSACPPNQYCIDNSCQALPPARIAFSVGSNAVQLLASATGYPAVGYGAATRLGDGSVLLSGGNLFTCNLPCTIADQCPNKSACNAGRCADASPTNLCATDATALLSASSSGNGLESRANLPRLGQPRYGHTSVRLLDNTVLISGGLQLGEGTVPKLVSATELFAPSELKLEDVPLWIERQDQPMLPGSMASNADLKGGVCLSRGEVGQVVGQLASPRTRRAQLSPTKTVTLPLPRTSSGRRMRTVRWSR